MLMEGAVLLFGCLLVTANSYESPNSLPTIGPLPAVPYAEEPPQQPYQPPPPPNNPPPKYVKPTLRPYDPPKQEYQPPPPPSYDPPKYDQPSYDPPKPPPKYDQPSYDPPKPPPKYDQPSYDPPSYDPPKTSPKYDPPKYDPPKQDYQQTTPNYEPPKQDYKPPPPKYDPPKYDPPKQDYKPPPPKYDPPKQDYKPPPPKYDPPKQDYPPPTPPYQAPAPLYDPPPKQYQPPPPYQASSPAPYQASPSYGSPNEPYPPQDNGGPNPGGPELNLRPMLSVPSPRRPAAPFAPSPLQMPQLQNRQEQQPRTLQDFEGQEILLDSLPHSKIDIMKFFGMRSRVVDIEASAGWRRAFMEDNNIPGSANVCPVRQVTCNINDSYRSMSGLCNNQKNPNMGAVGLPQLRFVTPQYEDGKHAPRGAKYISSKGYGSRLPNPRILSTNIARDIDHPDPVHSHLHMIFGQFLAHEITSTPKKDHECCNPQIRKNSRCFSIDVSKDEFFRNFSRDCLDITRSDITCQSGHEQREQFNGVTAFIDASSIYGNDDQMALKLRGGDERRRDGKLFKNPRLREFIPKRGDLGFDPDPILKDDEYASGDERVQQHSGVTALHVILFREHNRIAEFLKHVLEQKCDIFQRLDDPLKDEVLFQEARLLLGAELQSIVYKEYLPEVLSPYLMNEFNLGLKGNSFYNDSDTPQIWNEFAAAAFRFGHSQVQRMFNSTGNPWRLGGNYGNPEFAESEGGRGVAQEMEGAVLEPCQRVDHHFTTQVTNRLFEGKQHSLGDGYDLFSVNVQRGREHGIPNYNSMRKFARLSKIMSWEDIPHEISAENWELLRRNYKNPNDIDYYVAGLMEEKTDGGIVGPSFGRVIAEQFRALKDGDRFFFTHSQGPNHRGLPKPIQDMILRRTLSDIICQNTDLEEFPLKAFRTPSEDNRPFSCRGRPDIDFHAVLQSIHERLHAAVNPEGQRFDQGQPQPEQPYSDGGPQAERVMQEEIDNAKGPRILKTVFSPSEERQLGLENSEEMTNNEANIHLYV